MAVQMLMGQKHKSFAAIATLRVNLMTSLQSPMKWLF
jgi:hypothetical protein